MKSRLKEARDYILGKYPTKEWRLKVAGMKPRQVMAIYIRMKEKELWDKNHPDMQISLFDTNPEEMRAVYGKQKFSR